MHLPCDLFKHMLSFKDLRYEVALTTGTPTGTLIKELKFVTIADAKVVRPREPGTVFFIKHCTVYPRSPSLCFQTNKLR